MNTYSNLMVIGSDQLDTSPDKFYQNASKAVLDTPRYQFVQQTLNRDHLAHCAFVADSHGIPSLGIQPNALVIIGGWTNQQAANRTLEDHIRPALAGGPIPQAITDAQPIGCAFNPDITGFDPRTAVTTIMTWPDLGRDTLAIYHDVFAELLGGTKPMLEGSGTHFAFMNQRGEITAIDTFRNGQLQRAAQHDQIMPAVGRVFDRRSIAKADPEHYTGRPLGIAVQREHRDSGR